MYGTVVGQELYFTKCSPWYFWYPPGTIHSYYTVNWLYFLCCTLHPHDYFVTTNLYFSVPSPFSPSPSTSLPLAAISLFSLSESVSILFVCLFGGFSVPLHGYNFIKHESYYNTEHVFFHSISIILILIFNLLPDPRYEQTLIRYKSLIVTPKKLLIAFIIPLSLMNHLRLYFTLFNLVFFFLQSTSSPSGFRWG